MTTHDMPSVREAMAALSVRLALPLTALRGRSRVPAAVRGRQLLAYLWVEQCGPRASDLARALGQTRGTVSLAAKRGALTPEATELAAWCKKLYDLLCNVTSPS